VFRGMYGAANGNAAVQTVELITNHQKRSLVAV